MHLAHHPIFVSLSILIAGFGAWTALDLFRQARAHAGPWRRAWVAAAGLAMGLSIWSMHFIAMLGFNPGAPVQYEAHLTVVSLLLAIVATTVAFMTARPERTRHIASGLVMAGGICGMHYVGMAAVITSVRIANDPLFVVLAFLVAVFASTGALMAAMRVTTVPQRLLAAVVLGFAVVGMHYVAMLGVRISAGAMAHVGAPGIEPTVLAIGVAGGTLFVLLLALIAVLWDRRFLALAVQEASRGEQQLRAIFDNMPLGIVVAEAPSGEIRFANAEASRLLGHALEGPTIWAQKGNVGAVDAAGRRLAPEDHVTYQAMQTQRRVGPKVQSYRRPNGELVKFEVIAAPMPGLGKQGSLTVVSFQDVTVKLAAEEQAREAATLRESEERFRYIAEQAPVMLWMLDASGRRVYLNRAMREYQGFAGSDTDMGWRQSLAENDHAKLMRYFEKGLRDREGFSLEATFVRNDGERRLMHVLARPRFSENNEFLGLIGVNTDITAARHAQREQQQLNELLEQRVASALEQKAEAEAALMHAQRLESLGRLTGGVAHDFNNLLTVVIGSLDIILRDTTNAARRTRLGEAALAAARRGERLTAQLLAFARRQPLQPAICDLNELIRESESLLRRATGEQVRLTLDLTTTKAVALIDRTQFEACLLNLVVNAVDASVDGGEIGISTDITSLPAARESANAAQFARVTVWDRGQGMPPEVVHQIFEPFFTTKEAGKGTGLGLSQVYGFVKQSGGEVTVESSPGRGTRMSLLLPLQSATTDLLPARPAKAPALPRSLNILLAEDDMSVAGITQAMLGELGHNVTCTPNGDQALQVLRSDAPLDLLLTDVIMPGGMDGVTLANAARTIRPGLAVLLCSGYAGDELDEAIARGEWPLLRKPYLQSELADALTRAAAQMEEERTLSLDLS